VEEQIWKRRTRGDLHVTEVYKIMTEKEAIYIHKLFEISMENRTRGHGYKLYKKQTGTLRNRFFSARMVNPWNELDGKTLAVDMVEILKRKPSEFKC